MPPKLPSDLLKKAAKEAGKAMSQEMVQYGDEQQAPHRQIPQSRFGQEDDMRQLKETLSRNRKLQDFDSSLPLDLAPQQEQTTFQDLVKSSRGQQEPPTFAQISEAMQASIAGKLNFDQSVSEQKREEILNGFYEVLSNPETPTIVSDSFTAAATRGKMTEIEITDAPSTDIDDEMVDVKSHYDSYGGLFDEKVQAFGVNSEKTSDVMSNLAHEFTHVLQSNMESRRETSKAFTDGKLMEAFEKDLKVIDGLIQKRNFEYEINLESQDDDKAKEIHARVVESAFQNPEQARKTFPNTLERVEQIHSQYNQALAKDAMKSLGMGGRS